MDALDPTSTAADRAEIPAEGLSALLHRYVLGTIPPKQVERNEGYLKEWFSCWNCDWLGVGAALVEVRLPEGELRLACPKCETVLTRPVDEDTSS